MLNLIEALVAFQLSTKNLSAGTIQGKLTSQNAASGVAKMLDQAESIEDRSDQIQYFQDAENELWRKLADNMVPYWRSKNMLQDQDLNKDFSETFVVSVHFPEPKVIETEEERIRKSKFKIEAGFSTLRRELKKLYPTMSPEEIEQLVQEIKDEKNERQRELINEMQGEAPQ